jgi:hypothetical protein
MIRANCRHQLTAADFEFVAAAVSTRGGEREALMRALADEAERDAMLDDPRVFKALLELSEPLPVSLHLYFYVLVRRVLTQRGIHEREVADYVASLLAEFSQEERRHTLGDGDNEEHHYVADLLVAAERAPSERVFLIHSQVGNFSLFMTGIFPEHVQYRVWRRGAPGISFYEDVGSASFRLASHHALAHRHALREIYQLMAEQFRDVRLSLNRLSDALVHWEGFRKADLLP